ncbi:MAG: OPT/YSL family transporter, partial [Bacteroides sp.]|nr:OPT/YSL family transporter [Bacteroides sp.]
YPRPHPPPDAQESRGLGDVFMTQTTRSKDEAVNSARGEKGTLLASGFIAGGALTGVVSAILRYCNVNVINESWLDNPTSQVISLLAYICLIIFLVKASMSLKKEA